MTKHSDLPPRSRGRTIVIDKQGKVKAAPKKVPRAVAYAKMRRMRNKTKGAQKP